MNNSLFQLYYGKRVFVTGHTGFKGAWFITWLHLMGAHIKGFALLADEQGLFNIIAPQINFEHVIGDIRDKEKLQSELKSFQPHFVFHFAAQALVRRSYEIPAETFEVNVTGTANLMEGIIGLQNKCTVIVITTDKVYLNKEIDFHYTEADTLGGYDPYSASKACTELLVNSFRNSFFNIKNYKSHQKAIATARAGNVIGGGDWNKDRIIPDILRSLKLLNPVLVRNQHAVRPWQHVLEPLGGYLVLGALLHENVEQFTGAYNFGPEKSDHLRVKELVEIALTTWGSGTWVEATADSSIHEAGLLHLDITKAKDELSWKPKLTSKQAVEWTIDWYKQAPGKQFDYTLQQIKKFEQLDI